MSPTLLLDLNILHTNLERFLSSRAWYVPAKLSLRPPHIPSHHAYTTLPTKTGIILLSTSNGKNVFQKCFALNAALFEVSNDEDAKFLLAHPAPEIYVNIRNVGLTKSNFYRYSSSSNNPLPLKILQKQLNSPEGLVTNKKCNVLNIETATLSQTDCAAILPVACQKPLIHQEFSPAYLHEIDAMHTKLSYIENWLLKSVPSSLFNISQYSTAVNCDHATLIISKTIPNYPRRFLSPIHALREGRCEECSDGLANGLS
jgi:hypothetical protein